MPSLVILRTVQPRRHWRVNLLILPQPRGPRQVIEVVHRDTVYRHNRHIEPPPDVAIILHALEALVSPVSQVRAEGREPRRPSTIVHRTSAERRRRITAIFSTSSLAWITRHRCVPWRRPFPHDPIPASSSTAVLLIHQPLIHPPIPPTFPIDNLLRRNTGVANVLVVRHVVPRIFALTKTILVSPSSDTALTFPRVVHRSPSFLHFVGGTRLGVGSRVRADGVSLPLDDLQQLLAQVTMHVARRIVPFGVFVVRDLVH